MDNGCCKHMDDALIIDQISIDFFSPECMHCSRGNECFLHAKRLVASYCGPWRNQKMVFNQKPTVVMSYAEGLIGFE